MKSSGFKIYAGIARAIGRGGGEYTLLHGDDTPDKAVESGSTQGVANLGLEGAEHRLPGGGL